MYCVLMNSWTEKSLRVSANVWHFSDTYSSLWKNTEVLCMRIIYLSRKNIEVHMYGRIFFSGKLLEFYHLFLPHLQQIMAKPSISFGMSVHVSSQDTLIYVVLFSCASFLLGDFCDILACVWCNQIVS
jgi:hypothetical protein